MLDGLLLAQAEAGEFLRRLRADRRHDGRGADAWQALAPAFPVFSSAHGSGEEEAVALLWDRLRILPFDLAEDAVREAVSAARGSCARPIALSSVA